jgi:hypothetical protein
LNLAPVLATVLCTDYPDKLKISWIVASDSRGISRIKADDSLVQSPSGSLLRQLQTMNRSIELVASAVVVVLRSCADICVYPPASIIAKCVARVSSRRCR